MLPPRVDRVQVLLELGELPRPQQRVAVDHVGRVALLVPVLLRVRVQHKLRDRAVHARHVALHHHEARAGQLGPQREVHAQEILGHINMVTDREREVAGLSHLPHLHVLLLALPIGHGAVRGIGDSREDVVELVLDLLERVLRRLELALEALDGRHHLGGVLAVCLHLSDALRLGVALLQVGVHLDVDSLALLVHLDDDVSVQLVALLRQKGCDVGQLLRRPAFGLIQGRNAPLGQAQPAHPAASRGGGREGGAGEEACDVRSTSHKCRGAGCRGTLTGDGRGSGGSQAQHDKKGASHQ
mmetsp:Transcript_43310/g.108507  ORF Transcript_43310/g.108507 Transcript_43310/m.108507 type:complete len:299 (-) Transcript_43310:45-941(-)